jgi:tetratricopeptide (TPR) repeat protein
MVERSAPAPKNVQASAQLPKANAPSGNESYAAAAGEGFAALGAGRLEEARAAFERARALRPEGPEAADGLRRVNAATGQATVEDNAERAVAGNGKAVAQARAYALSLEAQERWENAASAYATILRHDASLSFAREGKARAQARQDLGDDVQAMLDRPDRLANSQQVRDQASALLQEARAQPSPGPVLSSQIARLTALLPNASKAVHIALVSDGVTQVEIPSVGTFGSFSRRDIQLRPGHYTVIGTREGYRDARRELVVSPERENQTVLVSCSEPT